MTAPPAPPAPREPVLRPEDLRAWDALVRAGRMHATTQVFRRRVDKAIAASVEALEWAQRLPPGVTPADAPRKAPWPRPGLPCVSISGGKDSTVMAHLVCVEAGLAGHVELVSEKDDLDFPGEREYVTALAARCGAPITILTPEVNPAAFVAALAARGELASTDDVHSRAAALSKTCFYAVMEANNARRPLTFLGLRAAESSDREKALDAARWKRARGLATGHPCPPGARTPYPVSGLVYWHAGQFLWRALPLGHFTGLDVFAYLFSRDIDPLPVYRCIAFMHREEPWRLRKSWWIPGAQTARGQTAWLRRYYPSLYRQLCQWMPDATLHG